MDNTWSQRNVYFYATRFAVGSTTLNLRRHIRDAWRSTHLTRGFRRIPQFMNANSRHTFRSVMISSIHTLIHKLIGYTTWPENLRQYYRILHLISHSIRNDIWRNTGPIFNGCLRLTQNIKAIHASCNIENLIMYSLSPVSVTFIHHIFHITLKISRGVRSGNRSCHDQGTAHSGTPSRVEWNDNYYRGKIPKY